MSERIYVTTPIYYVSDVPHLGHAYTTVVADTLARYHRLRGHDSRFLTGTDDHGQKIERMAASKGQTPKQYADGIAAAYQSCWRTLGMSNDDFIRTTDPDHEAVVQDIWRRLVERGWIVLRPYQGWYCVACEQFYPDKELDDGKCPVHKRAVERVEEENYFFKLSQWQKPLQEFYDRVLRETGRPFVEPAIRMNEVRAFVDAGLEDLSVSRATFKWGIPVPGDPRQVIYVWLDALTNYYSATRRDPSLARFWDGDAMARGELQVVHLMGKEITRFHAVYWPAFLMAAGLPPPSKIIAHGWWTVDGEKMSKTAGNVVDPNRLVADLDAVVGAKVGVDAFRYFVLREVPLGADGDFSHESLLTRYNAELANDLGNLLNRTLGMVWKYFPDDGVIRYQRAEAAPIDLASAFAAAQQEYEKAFAGFAPSKALEAVWSLVRAANAYIDKAAPWKQPRESQAAILGEVLETCRILAHWVSPVMPDKAAAILRQLGVAEAPCWPERRTSAVFHVEKATPLFPRIDDDRKKELLARWTPKPATATGTATQTATQAATTTPVKPTVTFDDFAKLDLRVAEIVAAERVPKKDKLLKLSVDVGGEMRQVVAGIAAAYAPEALVGRRAIFLANLKPAKIGGIVSEGMILAAGEEQILALSALDRDCPPGTKVR